MRKTTYLDPAVLRAKYTYDPDTGHISLRVSNQRTKAGHIYSSRYINEYIVVPYDGRRARAGRVAWVMMTGEQPNVIDHVNGIRHDNRWCNLRDVTDSENAINVVSYRKKNGTFVDIEALN